MATGLGHLLYATALLKSKTLHFPIGLHLRNNWVSLFVFSNVKVNAPTPGQTSLINIVSDGVMPVFNGQFILTTILTTILTAFLFILFILAIRKWTSNRQYA